MKRDTYNPDVLNCLANLSNDEVFTPPSLANQVLDLLPQELFASPTTTFLDPVSKSGVFLREIVKRLDRGLETRMPDRQERIEHILRKQVFGIAITELTAHLSRRSVYCSKNADSPFSVCRFDTVDGNIHYRPLRHTWTNGKCRYCGAPQEVYDRDDQAEQYAYEFIHTDKPHTLFNNMKFDVIIGNPPYQLSDGGNGASARPIYHLFVQQAKRLNPRFLCMIIPARWYAGGKGLDEFRKEMLDDNRISKLVDFTDSKDCFPSVDIAGGVCYFLWNVSYSGKCNYTNKLKDKTTTVEKFLNEYPIFIRYPLADSIVHKVSSFNERKMDTTVFPRKPFGLSTDYTASGRGDVKLKSNKGLFRISEDEVVLNRELLPEWKLIISYLTAEHAGMPDKQGLFKVLSTNEVLEPQSACTETYLLIGHSTSEKKIRNLHLYIRTQFVRFLLLLASSGQHITRATFQFVPLQDFSHPWTDEMLYQKYGLTDEEVTFIESMIRPME